MAEDKVLKLFSESFFDSPKNRKNYKLPTNNLRQRSCANAYYRHQAGETGSRLGLQDTIMTCRFTYMHSPVGRLTLVARAEKLAAILWENDLPTRVRLGRMSEDRDIPILHSTERQLCEYFAGTRKQFDLELDFAGTEFQQQVWHALLAIPFGETRSYSDIAHQIGNPRAVRAVGAANGKNPISIVAPCHRVIGSNGTLTGFAGGLQAKQALLQLEGVCFDHPIQTALF